MACHIVKVVAVSEAPVTAMAMHAPLKRVHCPLFLQVVLGTKLSGDVVDDGLVSAHEL